MGFLKSEWVVIEEMRLLGERRKYINIDFTK
jgi:hypothetical protein